MKKFSFRSIATICIVALLAVSCVQDKLAESIIPPGFKVVEFRTSSEMTKTFISEDDKEVTWIQGDEIRIFYEGGSTTANAETSGSYSVFRAVVPESSTCYAAYPSDISTFQDGAFSVTIPAEQDGAFANGHVALALLKEKETSKFHNVTSFLKVAVDDSEYTKVVVKAVGGEKIAGTLSVAMEGDNPVIGELTDGSDEITLNVVEPGTYYIAIAPEVTFSKGILATYYKGNTAAGSYFLDGNFRIDRAVIASVGILEEKIGHYYVSQTGANAKTGANAENAMSPAELRTLLNAADTDKVFAQAATLDSAVIYLAEGTYDMEELVAMSYGGRKVKIAFEGVDTSKTVITGNKEHRLFVIGSGVNVSFDKIAFRDSRSYISTEPGILLEEGSESKFTNCLIADNVNEDADTLGLHHSQAGIKTYGKSYFENCEFARNKASYGASLTLDADATVKDCKFYDNEGIHGPGNSLYVDANCTVNVQNCQFIDNKTSLMDGGAVAISAGRLNMSNCTFTGNSNSGWRGGALYAWNNAKVTLTGCQMTKNTSRNGGAIFTQNNSELEIVGGNFGCESEIVSGTFGGKYEDDGNTAVEGGGFLYQGGDSKVTIKENAAIKNNCAAEGYGSAIVMGSDEGFLTCENVTFEGNTNESSGGDKPYGGAVATTGKGMITIKNCTFKYNTNSTFGGAAINMAASGNALISGCTFEGNVSESTDIPNSNNNGRYGGGAIRFDSTGDVSVENCTFAGNKVGTEAPAAFNHAYGGAVYVNAAGKYRFNGCKFKDNYAVRGGAFCVWATGSNVYMNACSFDGNYISFINGSTIHIEKAEEFCMNNCSINDNTWAINGGNKTWEASWVNLSTIRNICLSNCSFIGNPKYGASPQVSTRQNSIVRFDSIIQGSHYFVNNIVVSDDDGTDGSPCIRSFANYNTREDNISYFTKRGDNSQCDAGGNWTTVESPASNGFDKEDFGLLSWSISDMCWTWNGVMSGGKNTGLAEVETAVDYIGQISGFKTWLEQIGALYKDQLGNPRPTSGNWWPGAYQGPSAL